MISVKILIITLCAINLLHGETKPNIVLIYADDLGIGMLGSQGQKVIKTPHIDKLAAEGMSFTNYYGGTLCAPARWSLLTGMHFGRKGAWRHNSPGWIIRSDIAKMSDEEQLKGLNAYVKKSSVPIPDNEVFLAEVAQKAGYKTAQFGKLDVGFLTNHERVKRFGWDHYHGYFSHSRAHGFYPPYLWKDGEKVRYEGNDDIRCGKMSEKGNEPVGSGGKVYSEHLFIKGALDFITESKNKPFFLYYATQLPHGPVAIPELHASVKDNEKLSLAEKKYASMVIMLDDHVGLIMKKLKEHGLDENTIVFFTSDNGHELYYGPKKSFPKSMHGEPTNDTDKKWRTSEGGDVFDGAGGRAGIKRAAYQGGKQSPMIVRWPQKIKAGSKTDLMSSHYDFMATLAGLTNQEIPKGKDSISYLPTLFGKEQKERHDYIVFDNGFSRMGKTALITQKGWKVIEIERAQNKFQLYNIREDNEERHELSAKHPEKLAELIKVLLKELKSPRPDLQ